MSTSQMPNISVRRYSHPETHGWAGWIEPEDRDWIVFVGVSGEVRAYLDREPSGAIVTPGAAVESGSYPENG